MIARNSFYRLPQLSHFLESTKYIPRFAHYPGMSKEMLSVQMTVVWRCLERPRETDCNTLTCIAPLPA